jgi:hypothetical protein
MPSAGIRSSAANQFLLVAWVFGPETITLPIADCQLPICAKPSYAGGIQPIGTWHLVIGNDLNSFKKVLDSLSIQA